MSTYEVVPISEIGTLYKLIRIDKIWAMKEKKIQDQLTTIVNNEFGTITKEDLQNIADQFNYFEKRINSLERECEILREDGVL